MATYGSAEGANALVPTWNGSTNPTIVQVDTWLAEAHAKINRAVASAGYVAPVAPSTVALYPELTGLENLYAGAYILRSIAVDVASGETEDRSEVWLKDFYGQLKDLAASNLSLLGATLLPSSTVGRRRRIRTLQMRKVDGYSRGSVGETWAVQQGEYTGASAPSE